MNIESIQLKRTDLKYLYDWSEHTIASIGPDKFNRSCGEEVMPLLQSLADEFKISDLKIIHDLEDSLQLIPPETRIRYGVIQILRAKIRKILSQREGINKKMYQ